jgi:hypothetical protein
MQNTDNNSRRDFLKKLPSILGSLIPLSGLVFHEALGNSNKGSNIKSLSKGEADEMIKNSISLQRLELTPKPAPIEKRN